MKKRLFTTIIFKWKIYMRQKDKREKNFNAMNYCWIQLKFAIQIYIKYEREKNINTNKYRMNKFYLYVKFNWNEGRPSLKIISILYVA